MLEQLQGSPQLGQTQPLPVAHTSQGKDGNYQLSPCAPGGADCAEHCAVPQTERMDSFRVPKTLSMCWSLDRTAGVSSSTSLAVMGTEDGNGALLCDIQRVKQKKKNIGRKRAGLSYFSHGSG